MTSKRWIAKALDGVFPRRHALDDGAELVLRPLRADDEELLKDYFHQIPVAERVRFMRDNVVDPALVRSWCQEIDVSRVIPLVALAGERIVADATLHLGEPGMKSHVGQTRLSIDPEYRGRGVAQRLISELLDFAPEAGIAWVDAEAQASDRGWIEVLEAKGFKEAGRLVDHARDNLGNHDDVLLYTRCVEAPFASEIGGEG